LDAPCNDDDSSSNDFDDDYESTMPFLFLSDNEESVIRALSVLDSVHGDSEYDYGYGYAIDDEIYHYYDSYNDELYSILYDEESTMDSSASTSASTSNGYTSAGEIQDTRMKPTRKGINKKKEDKKTKTTVKTKSNQNIDEERVDPNSNELFDGVVVSSKADIDQQQQQQQQQQQSKSFAADTEYQSILTVGSGSGSGSGSGNNKNSNDNLDKKTQHHHDVIGDNDGVAEWIQNQQLNKDMNNRNEEIEKKNNASASLSTLTLPLSTPTSLFSSTKTATSAISTSTPTSLTKIKQKTLFGSSRAEILRMNMEQKRNLSNFKNKKIPIEIPSSIDAIRTRRATAAAAASISSRSKRSKQSPLGRFPFFPQQQQQQSSQLQQSQQLQENNISPPSTKAKKKKQQQQQSGTAVLSKKISKKGKSNKTATTMSLTTPWARTFILSRPKDALLPIPRDFLTDGFNLVQLAPIIEKAMGGERMQHHVSNAASSSLSPPSISLYKAALRLILEDTETNNLDSNSNPSVSAQNNNNHSNQNPMKYQTGGLHTPSQIQKAAEVLYTLVHARYVTSPRGLDTIRRMFLRNYELGTNEVFGKCPRMSCSGTPLLPFGVSCLYDFDGKDGIYRKSMRYCCSCGEVRYIYFNSMAC
jgi:hypothetical protein